MPPESAFIRELQDRAPHDGDVNKTSASESTLSSHPENIARPRMRTAVRDGSVQAEIFYLQRQSERSQELAPNSFYEREYSLRRKF